MSSAGYPWRESADREAFRQIWKQPVVRQRRRTTAPPTSYFSQNPPTDFAAERDAILLRRGATEKLVEQHGSVKVLLVFPRDDQTVAAIRGAAGQLRFECSLARTAAHSLDAFQSRGHDVVFVDNRDSRLLDGLALAKSLRNVKGSQFSLLVALVKKTEMEKPDSSLIQYIDAGYDRWVSEPSLGAGGAAAFLNELLLMDTVEVRPRRQLWAFHAFLLMAERSRELCLVTDTTHHILYANRAAERASGLQSKELLGRSVYDLVHVESKERLLTAAGRGREWEGVASLAPNARRGSDALVLQCRVTPNGAAGRTPANLVYVLEPPPKRGSEAGISGRGSVPSVRRGSADMRSVCSDGMRRQSVTKLNALSIEAPITKVVTLISQAQEQSSPEVSLMLDKVIDILRNTELYSPIVREDRLRPDDPVTSDLISALLQDVTAGSSFSMPRGRSVVEKAGTSVNAPTTRRSSNDSAVARGASAHAARGSRPPPPPSVNTQLSALLDTAHLWEFDIFKLEELTGMRPLVHLGMSLMEHFEVPQTLNVDSATMHNWLSIIEMNYRSANTYHNSSHAADVMQSSAAFMERERLQRILDPLDTACCLIAAAVHDVDHPGRSSAFLCNSDHELAILYNDMCVLESHHAALAFRLTVSDERVNIFKGLDRDVYKLVRVSIIDMVLATEMTKHFEHLAKFVNVFSKPVRDDDESTLNHSRRSLLQLGVESDGVVMTQENVALAKRMLIKCADVSNPARPLRMCVEWALRIAEEYFQQTDEEKQKELPVVMPMFDRATCSIPKSQIGFMDFIINDMFEAWEAFLNMPQLQFYLDINYKYWHDLEKSEIRWLDVDHMNLLVKKFGWYGDYKPLPMCQNDDLPFMTGLVQKEPLSRAKPIVMKPATAVTEPTAMIREINQKIPPYLRIVFPTRSGSIKKYGPGARIGSRRMTGPWKKKSVRRGSTQESIRDSELEPSPVAPIREESTSVSPAPGSISQPPEIEQTGEPRKSSKLSLHDILNKGYNRMRDDRVEEKFPIPRPSREPSERGSLERKLDSSIRSIQKLLRNREHRRRLYSKLAQTPVGSLDLSDSSDIRRQRRVSIAIEPVKEMPALAKVKDIEPRPLESKPPVEKTPSPVEPRKKSKKRAPAGKEPKKQDSPHGHKRSPKARKHPAKRASPKHDQTQPESPKKRRKHPPGKPPTTPQTKVTAKPTTEQDLDETLPKSGKPDSPPIDSEMSKSKCKQCNIETCPAAHDTEVFGTCKKFKKSTQDYKDKGKE